MRKSTQSPPLASRWLKTAGLIGSWLLFLLAVILGFLGAVVTFFGAAFIMSSLFGLIIAALLVCMGITTGLTWLATRRIAPTRRGRMTLGTSAILILLISGLATGTIFQPLASPSQSQASLSNPSSVGYWDLPTGSHIAYFKVNAVGVASPTPLVVLHGGPVAWAVSLSPMTTFFSRFASLGYDVYLYDQIGSGLSARLEDPTEYTVTRHIADLEAIRQQIGVQQMILLGESWGGSLAAGYMALHPEHVAKVIFESPGSLYYPQYPSAGNQNMLLTKEEKQRQANTFSKPRFLAWAILNGINPRAAHSFASDQEMDGLFADALSSSNAIAGTVCDRSHLPKGEVVQQGGFYANQETKDDAVSSQPDPRKKLASNPTPALILTGECNYIKWEVTHQYKMTLPNATLLYIPRAGHFIYLDQPEVFFTSVQAFLLNRSLPLKPYTGDTSPTGH